jgi:ubiquinone/menaquinone biosynthesis C-methylase UbiE
MVHEMTLTIMGGKLFHAPIGPSPDKVIDLGTGTGIWAIEFGKGVVLGFCSVLLRRGPPDMDDAADEHPSAEVIGNDLSPTQLPLFVEVSLSTAMMLMNYRTPSNLRFIVDDIESEWTYGTNTFDFIHARYLCYSIKDYRKLLRQCYE